MGIVNLTPDSFSDGGRYRGLDEVLSHIETMIEEGADIIDIGAESSRPGAHPISAKEEILRLSPLLSVFAHHFKVPFSVDTTKSEVADLALSCGAHFINDISAFKKDPGMPAMIAKHGAGVILMHMQGTPETMQQNPLYDNVVASVVSELKKAIDTAQKARITNIVIDPGIGFGKNLEHTMTLLRHLPDLVQLGFPVLVGLSRKSFVGTLLGDPVEERLYGSLASGLYAWMKGAQILRVHDILPYKKCIDTFMALEGISHV